MVEQTIINQATTTTMPTIGKPTFVSATSTSPSVYSYYVDHGYRADPAWNTYLQSDQFKQYWLLKNQNPTGYRSTETYLAHRGMKQRIKEMFFKNRNVNRSTYKTYRSLPQWTTYIQSPAYQNYILLKKNNPTGYRTTSEYQTHLTYKNQLKGKGLMNRLFHFRSDKAYKARPEWGQYAMSNDYATYRNLKLANPSTYKTLPAYQTHLERKKRFKLF